MKLVIIESPYAGDVRRNLLYLRACIRDCVDRGESPYASHRMLTDALNDDILEERERGIAAGLAWRYAMWADSEGLLRPICPVFYVDFGWSDGMKRARDLYDAELVSYETRRLPEDAVGAVLSTSAREGLRTASSGALPDGSGFFTVSMPLPKTHWIYADGDNVPPAPMRMGRGQPRTELAAKVSAAAQYAVRASTMNGKEMDFDPDALVQNMIVGLLGYWTEDGRSGT